jgi:hypothetical protein
MTPGGTTPQPQSAKAIAYKSMDMAFDAYDLGMTTLRTLQKSGVITAAKYTEIKDKVGWPAYNAIKAADDAVQAWAAAETTSNYDKMTAAFQVMTASQKSFTDLLTSLQGGRVYPPGTRAGAGLGR